MVNYIDFQMLSASPTLISSLLFFTIFFPGVGMQTFLILIALLQASHAFLHRSSVQYANGLLHGVRNGLTAQD